MTTHGKAVNDRTEMRRVKIVEVNLDAEFPMAIGRDGRSTGGGLYRIDLSQGVGGDIIIPRPGEVWWITRRTQKWALSHRQSIAEARSGGTPPQSPPGILVAFAGAEAPNGWLICDGTAVGREEYADLFAVIGTSYGYGDGATTFNLPDLRGRWTLGWVGESYKENFTEEQLPLPYQGLELGEEGGVRGRIDHSHPIQHSRYAAPGGIPIPNLRTDLQDHTHTRPAGTQIDAPERQPYLTLNHIIKT